MEQVYYGELDRQPGSEHVWLHHPAGPHAGKYVSAIDDVQLVD